MKKLLSSRIESLDILRGLVMILMALDHTRDYFHLGMVDPNNLATTTPLLFTTRFITHFCAPVFVFLAGTSAYLYGANKTKHELFKFLITRGVWLIVLEIFLNNFLWWFDIHFAFIQLQVIWAIGCCMVLLSFLIYLPKKVLLALGLLIVFGHNLLDGIVMEGESLSSLIWYAIHQANGFFLSEFRVVRFSYPIIPWLGIIIIGYCFGKLYDNGFDVNIRRKLLFYLGLGSIALFFILRGINGYGDLVPWEIQEDTVYTIISFMNVTKYPPSLAYTLITLGPAMLFLLGIEKIKNQLTDFIITFGRVPLFYYFMHILVIHLASMLAVMAIGGSYTERIYDYEMFMSGNLNATGFDLGGVYLVWIGVIILLYPMCNWYMKYKAKNKEKWWLSYL